MPVENKTILIAEDNAGIVDLLTVVLTDEGAKIISAKDGQEAVKKAKENLPDLILLDIMMPFMDGWEVATRLLTDTRTSEIPIMFLTARAAIPEQMRGWSMPIFDYITKPFEIDDLVKKVNAVLSVEPDRKPELREQLRRERLRALLGMDENRKKG